MVDEARLEQLETGLAPVTDGWFVVNIPEGPWVTNEVRGDACIFESDDAPFADVGFTLCVIQPGQKGWPDAKGIVYPRSELALRHGAGVEVETTVPAEAYAGLPPFRHGPPASWAGMPWG